MKEGLKQPILSICIPTWNRSKFLSISLESFLNQMNDIDSTEIEFFVSDNCSDDDTPLVVQDYIKKGLPIVYNRNEENIGAARNFARCMQRATGTYILLLGDDDIFKPGMLKYLLDSIRDKEYGLIHIHKHSKIKDNIVEYSDSESFLKQVSRWITFMSANIFRKEVVGSIDNDRYIDTHFLQLPYYITSAIQSDKNLIINQELMQTGLDDANIGGYNFFEVFVKNYLNIWMDFVNNGIVSIETYRYIKRDILPFIYHFIKRLLVFKERRRLKADNGWKIVFDYYGREWYFYTDFIKWIFVSIKNRLWKRRI